jgi:hypothetical protein
MVISFLEGNIKEIEEKYRSLHENNEGTEEISDSIFDELFIYTQSIQESEKNLWTSFRFSGGNLKFSEITTAIEKHYEKELHFYYINDKILMSSRIKDESDFINILNELMQDTRQFKRSNLLIRLFVENASKATQIVKYVMNCVSCNIRYEIDEKSMTRDNSSLCDYCKSVYLTQIVTNISLNRTSPFKHLTGFQTIFK